MERTLQMLLCAFVLIVAVLVIVGLVKAPDERLVWGCLAALAVALLSAVRPNP